MNKLRILLLALVISCNRIPDKIPDGFAKLQVKDKSIRAVSPEGVMYRAYWVTKAPAADAVFWIEAMVKQLERSGYHKQNEGNLRTKSGYIGAFVETAAPMATGDVKYWSAFLSFNDKILVIESGGDIASFDKRISAIKSNVESF